MDTLPQKTTKFPSFIFAISIIITGLYSCKSSVTTLDKVEEKVITANEVYTETIPIANLSFDMVLVPEGEFLMGSPATEVNRKEDEGPQKKVALDAYWMGKYEVTWSVFELFFKQNQPLLKVWKLTN